VVAGEIYAQGIIRIRFLKRSRGIVTPDEVLAHSHEFVGEHPVLPEWVKVWAENSSLPKGMNQRLATGSAVRFTGNSPR
jgi:hypothetical protein